MCRKNSSSTFCQGKLCNEHQLPGKGLRQCKVKQEFFFGGSNNCIHHPHSHTRTLHIAPAPSMTHKEWPEPFCQVVAQTELLLLALIASPQQLSHFHACCSNTRGDQCMHDNSLQNCATALRDFTCGRLGLSTICRGNGSNDLDSLDP
eukprot:1160552-Pelagomonas_calceolata.AAC.11